MTKKKNVHVTKRDDGWAVVSEGSKRAAAIKTTQKEAIVRAREISVNGGGGELVIHGRDNKIRKKDTTRGGNDPFPPRDKDFLPKSEK